VDALANLHDGLPSVKHKLGKAEDVGEMTDLEKGPCQKETVLDSLVKTILSQNTTVSMAF
jgi:hypothetical protein